MYLNAWLEKVDQDEFACVAGLRHELSLPPVLSYFDIKDLNDRTADMRLIALAALKEYRTWRNAYRLVKDPLTRSAMTEEGIALWVAQLFKRQAYKALRDMTANLRAAYLKDHL